MAITSVKTGSSFTSLIKYDTFLGPNSAYIPTSFESIASVTPSGVATVTFSSIPQTYKSLQIRGISKDGTGSGVSLQFNSDTGANYADHVLLGNGSSVIASSNGASQTSILNATRAGNSTFFACIIDIHDYASTSKYKTIRSFSGVDSNGVDTQRVALSSGLWMSTSAVSSITITDVNTNFSSGTTFALYGIS